MHSLLLYISRCILSCGRCFQGITGHELCHYFWDTSVRMEWEGTLDTSAVVENISADTVVSHQVHKRVWPTTQRDALFWSHIRLVPGANDSEPDRWIVCNYSTEHDKAPVSTCLNINPSKFHISFYARTLDVLNWQNT